MSSTELSPSPGTGQAALSVGEKSRGTKRVAELLERGDASLEALGALDGNNAPARKCMCAFYGKFLRGALNTLFEHVLSEEGHH